MFYSSKAQPPVMLGSWKEIAAHFGKGVRTVQRWEQQFGLPVRRPMGRANGMVSASPAELDKWLEQKWSQRTQELPAAPDVKTTMYATRLSMAEMAELRERSRRLRAELQAAVHTMVTQCQSLRERVNGNGNGANGSGKTPASNRRAA